MRRFLSRLLATLLFSGAIAAIIIMLPVESLLGTMQWVQTPLAVLVVICALGKLLYDTLFYDRYA